MKSALITFAALGCGLSACASLTPARESEVHAFGDLRVAVVEQTRPGRGGDETITIVRNYGPDEVCVGGAGETARRVRVPPGATRRLFDGAVLPGTELVASKDLGPCDAFAAR